MNPSRSSTAFTGPRFPVAAGRTLQSGCRRPLAVADGARGRGQSAVESWHPRERDLRPPLIAAAAADNRTARAAVADVVDPNREPIARAQQAVLAACTIRCFRSQATTGCRAICQGRQEVRHG